MEYGININFFVPLLGMEKSAELIARAGFTKLDYTPPITDDGWQNTMREDLAVFRANGLSVHQTHAPFNRYGKHGDKHLLYVERCAEATEQTGARFMVVHGDEFDFEHLDFSPEAALDYNHAYFAPFVRHAEKNGYKVAFETVFEDWDRRRFSSKADELLSLIRSYESEAAVCCWDFGHAHIAFKHEEPRVIAEFGALIQCTHLHDNTGRDSHQLPFTGRIRWAETVAALKNIPYNGVLSVEYSHGSMPAHLMADFISLTYKTAAHVWSL